MATNPKLPPRRDFSDNRAELIPIEKRSNWWPPVLIIAALAVIGALIWWLSSSPNRGASPTSVNGNGVQLTQLRVTTATANGVFDVLGTLVNTGQTPVTGVNVEATFKGVNGKNLERVSADVQPASAIQSPPPGPPAGSANGNPQPSQTHGFATPGRGQNSAAGHTPNQQNSQAEVGFASNPVQPGQSVPIAIRFTHMPEGATQGLPRLRITNVQTAQSAAGRAR